MRPTTNPAFWRALHSLAHPVSVAAVLLLLLNDHWLRWHYPSWLTGKLGDFTWLVFAPFIAAAALAWVVPRGKNNERLVGLLAFAFIGLWFALAKTVPAVHGLTVQTWEAVIGWRGTLRMDATDLLTLPALLLGWCVWRRAGNTALNLRPLAWAALGLGVVATLATSPSDRNYGVGCLKILHEQVYVFVVGDYGVDNSGWYSEDGGLSWFQSQQDIPYDDLRGCSKYPVKDFELTDPTHPNTIYRFRQAQDISTSMNGGRTWEVQYDLTFLRADIRRYFHELKQDKPYLAQAEPGPFDAVFDPQTRNLIIAMGQDGILVRTSDQLWNWIAIGPYHPIDIYDQKEQGNLLRYEFALAAILLTLSWIFLSGTIKKGEVLEFALFIMWAIWLCEVLFAPYKWSQESIINIISFIIFPEITTFVLGMLSIPLVVIAIWVGYKQKISPRKMIISLVWALLSAFLFFVPYVLWSQGVIHSYRSTAVIAILISTVFLIGKHYLLPVLPKPEVKSTEAESAPGN